MEKHGPSPGFILLFAAAVLNGPASFGSTVDLINCPIRFSALRNSVSLQAQLAANEKQLDNLLNELRGDHNGKALAEKAREVIASAADLSRREHDYLLAHSEDLAASAHAARSTDREYRSLFAKLEEKRLEALGTSQTNLRAAEELPMLVEQRAWLESELTRVGRKETAVAIDPSTGLEGAIAGEPLTLKLARRVGLGGDRALVTGSSGYTSANKDFDFMQVLRITGDPSTVVRTIRNEILSSLDRLNSSKGGMRTKVTVVKIRGEYWTPEELRAGKKYTTRGGKARNLHLTTELALLDPTDSMAIKSDGIVCLPGGRCLPYSNLIQIDRTPYGAPAHLAIQRTPRSSASSADGRAVNMIASGMKVARETDADLLKVAKRLMAAATNHGTEPLPPSASMQAISRFLDESPAGRLDRVIGNLEALREGHRGGLFSQTELRSQLGYLQKEIRAHAAVKPVGLRRLLDNLSAVEKSIESQRPFEETSLAISGLQKEIRLVNNEQAERLFRQMGFHPATASRSEWERIASLESAITQSPSEIRKIQSLHGLSDLEELAGQIERTFAVSDVTIEQLNGTSGSIISARYKNRDIRFETEQNRGDLSESLEGIFNRSKRYIDAEEKEARLKHTPVPNYPVFPDLLEQQENYHLKYQENFLLKKFRAEKMRSPRDAERKVIQAQALINAKNTIARASTIEDAGAYFRAVMATPRWPDQARSVEEVAERILAITSPQYQAAVRKAIVEKSSPRLKESIVKVYNAFNSEKFDRFMALIAEQSLKLCRQAGECYPNQKLGIPDKFMALFLQRDAKRLGISLEIISKYVGREPGRLYMQRIRRGSLMIDEGAPGNHGTMSHGLQNLFIYEQIGKERTIEFFNGLSGWAYERMFDANASYLPIPSTRDITRRHYWNGVLRPGDRAALLPLGELTGEAGRYPDFLRINGLELIAVEELEQNLLNVGSRIRASYKGREIMFTADRDGAPSAGALEKVQREKKRIDAER